MSSEVKRYDPINSDGTCGMCVEDADYGAYVEYADYAALEAECERLRQTMLRLVTTHCAAAMKNNATTTDLDQYLSAGIAQLEAGILELRAQLAAIKGQEPGKQERNQ